jgi:cytochrome c-type biogenesis protein CcmE
MSAVRSRWLVLPGLGVAGVLLGAVLFGNLNRNLVYYLTPSEAVAKRAAFPDGRRRFRLGGLVRPGSQARLVDGSGVAFTVTDTRGASVRVVFHGRPSQLFQPGIGVIVEGAWAAGRFHADTMLVKHDETYRPPTSTGGVPPGPAQARARAGP